MKREFKIGLFAVLVLAGLYWGINFLKGRDIFRRNMDYYAWYDNVSGIQLSSPVVIKGVKVGNVSGIQYDPSVSDMVRLTLSIKSAYRLPSNSVARIFINGLMGGKAIEIDLGDDRTYLEDGAVIKSETDVNFLETASSDMEAIKQKASALVNQLTETLTGINSILAQNSGELNRTMHNLSSITGNINEVLAAEKAELKEIISNVEEITAAFGRNSARIDSTLVNVDRFTSQLAAADVGAAVEKLDGVLYGLNEIVGRLESGEGTAGLLLNDRALYDSLTCAAGNLSLLLEDLRENPGDYVHFSLFGRRNKK